MKADIPSGKYILAVSGGVDSMALLDILSKKSGLALIVAHFNHGIRADAEADETLVKEAARRKGLAVEIGYGRLGSGASEEKARKARYEFLKRIMLKHQADAVVTAHHQDDL